MNGTASQVQHDPGKPPAAAPAAHVTPGRRRVPIHVMAKPIGPLCNLDCAYCYYLEKEQLFPHGERFRMTDELLEEYVRQYIEAQPGPEIHFTWQGGEPTLMGLPFFRRAVELERRYASPGSRITNALQTNGTLLDEDWAAFFREEGFLVGISLDGPPELHDAYRVDKGGHPTIERVVRGLRLLVDADVDVNVLCVVNRQNSRRPLDVYRFLTGLGVRHLQFIPLVEPTTSGPVSVPVSFEDARAGVGVSERSVLPDDFGRFLISIFEEWIARDVGRVFVQTFEETLTSTLGLPPSLCIFSKECGSGLAMEHNGDVFSCDHFVRSEHSLGNLRDLPIVDLAALPAQVAFGQAKRETLPDYCRSCEVLRYCNGECPKNRVAATPEGALGLNYLCVGYRQYFNAVRPSMERIAELMRRGLPAGLIMSEVAAFDATRFVDVGRNDPCPCGSDRKYKKCHLGDGLDADRRVAVATVAAGAAMTTGKPGAREAR